MKVTINLPTSTTIKHHGDESIIVVWDQLPANVVAAIAEVGAKTILTNVWNGGGKDATEAERASAVNKKLDAWKRGEFNVNNRGEARTTLEREAFRNLLEAAVGSLTDKAFWEAQADAVHAATNKRPETGKVVPFDVMLESWAKRQAKNDGVEYEATLAALQSKVSAEADRIAGERAKALTKLDITGISI